MTIFIYCVTVCLVQSLSVSDTFVRPSMVVAKKLEDLLVWHRGCVLTDPATRKAL